MVEILTRGTSLLSLNMIGEELPPGELYQAWQVKMIN